MSLHKNPDIIKLSVVISTVSIVLITIFLIPVSRKASFWNRCLDKTVSWINENEIDLKGWDKEAKESLAVAVCNGAVFEPKLQKE